jgi:hypothetical protein
MVLDEDYRIVEELGVAPVKVEGRENLQRYAMTKTDGTSDYVLVLYPKELNGKLSLDLRSSPIMQYRSESAALYSRYFDRLLRAHRLVLKGDFVNAKRLIQRIESDFDAGFGTAVLLGNIALLSGDLEEANKHFKVANELRPNATTVAAFIRRDERVR